MIPSLTILLQALLSQCAKSQERTDIQEVHIISSLIPQRWLRVLPALPDDPASVLRSHISSPRNLIPSYSLCQSSTQYEPMRPGRPQLRLEAVTCYKLQCFYYTNFSAFTQNGVIKNKDLQYFSVDNPQQVSNQNDQF